MKDSLKKISFALVVFVLPIFTLLPYSPWVMKGLHRDSGVFLYVGQQILNGGLPYRDIWDHKPPVIYYVNALGLLFDNSRWGVWTIELVCLVISSLLAYQLIKKHFGDFVGLIVSTLWLLTLVFVLQGGNLTEEYALVFQFLLLVMFDRINGKNRSILYFSVGVFSGLMFCIKQTTIGIFLGIIVLTLYKMFGKRQLFLFKNIFLIILGWTLFPAFWVLYFYIHGGLPNLLEAFYYNFVYSSQNKDLLNRLAPLITGIEPLTETGFFQFGMIGYILLVMDIFLGKDNNKWLVNLLQLIAVTLPIEYVLVSLSGHTYKHYYITLLPMLSLSSAYFIKVIINYCSLVHKQPRWIMFGIIVIIIWTSIPGYKNIIEQNLQKGNEEIISFIKNSTKNDDSVLFWGAESSLNFLTVRKSPTRYVYQYPLYTERYVNSEMIETFLDELIRNRPKYIVDTKNSQTPIWNFPVKNEKIVAKVEYLKSHYRYIRPFQQWAVYQYFP